MTKKFIALIATTAALNLAAANLSHASSEKKSQKNIEVSSEDLSLQLLDPQKAQSPELQNKIQSLKTMLDKYKTAMDGRAAILSKADEPPLPPEMDKNGAENKTPGKIAKQSSQKAKISSFPSSWEGRWAGPAILGQMVFSKTIQKAQPKAVASVSGNMHTGRVGFCELVFEANADCAQLKQFPQVTFRIGPKEAPFVPGARVGASSFIGTGPARNTILSNGSIKNSQILFCRLSQLKPEVIEQDSGEKSITVFNAKQIQADMRENVVYYAIVGPDQMYVYIAQIDYLGNGDFKSKLLMHAILKRKHESA